MNKPSKYTKFNRHETYTPKMLSMGMKLSNGVASSTVENYIYGLHDGYLYTMLMDVVYLKSEGISDEKIADILELTNLILKLKK